MNKKNNLRGSLILTLTSLIWGLAFVAQSSASDKVPPFMFNSLRSFIGAFALILTLLVIKLINKKRILPTTKSGVKTMLTGGIVCGVLLTISVNLQQAGLSVYPEGVAGEARGGFITALYVIIVPLISVFLKKPIKPQVWVAVVVAIIGVYLLCVSHESGGIYLGDILIFICALSFSLHILAIDKFAEPIGGILLSTVQFLVCALLSLTFSLIFEDVNWIRVTEAIPSILYVGIMSSGVAYTLQIIGQKFAEPTVASISMSLESVFAALGGWVIMGNKLSFPELVGCTLVFIAIIIAQLNFKSIIYKIKNKKIKSE